MEKPKADHIPPQFADCVCEECLKLFSGGSEGEATEDYYFENGFLVFTEKYHLKRGYCCHSGCRYCPYKNP